MEIRFLIRSRLDGVVGIAVEVGLVRVTPGRELLPRDDEREALFELLCSSLTRVLSPVGVVCSASRRSCFTLLGGGWSSSPASRLLTSSSTAVSRSTSLTWPDLGEAPVSVAVLSPPVRPRTSRSSATARNLSSSDSATLASPWYMKSSRATMWSLLTPLM